MFKKILCPVDFSKTSINAAKHAMEYALHNKAEITFIHVIDIQTVQDVGDLSGGAIDQYNLLVEEERPVLEKLKDECEKKRIKVKTILNVGDPRDLIIEELKNGGYDLIIMGTHGKTGLTRAVLGSMAESIVRDSKVPVLLYHYQA